MKRPEILIFCIMLASFGCSDDRDVYIQPHGVESKCPEDSLKTEPGVCGCDTPDEDTNNNDIIDCLEKDVDKCPDDPAKTEPGQCGCGYPDDDANHNGVLDCIELGIVEDDCPDDPQKIKPGKCGCGVEDSPQNTADNDKDGVINCYDQCPDNPDITVDDGSGCGTPSVTPGTDRDGDTVPDSEDACPDNPDIKTNINDGAVDCNPAENPDNVIEVRTASDFETVRTKLNELLASPTEGQFCENAASVCADSTTILECRNGVWRALPCASCSSNQCTSPSNTYKMPSHNYTIRVMNDINLADGYTVSTDASGNCTTSTWKSIPHVNNVRFETVNNATISFTSNGKRCALPEPLIHQAALSEFANLTLDYDMTASAQTSFIDIADSVTMSNVVYKGSIKTEATDIVGGIIAQTTSTQDDANNDVVKTTLSGVVCTNASIQADKATVVGGVVGKLADAVLSSGTQTHQLTLIKGKSKVGGIVGEMTSDFDKPVLKQFKSNIATVECTSSYCGGAIGVVSAPAEISNVEHKVNTVSSNPSEYTAGFAGGIFLADDSMAGDEQTILVTNISSEVATINASDGIYAAGFAGYADGPATFSNITSKASAINGSYFAGGFFGSAHDITATNIQNDVTNLSVISTSQPASYVGGFAAEISGGKYSKVASILGSLKCQGVKSSATEDANSIAGFVATISNAIQLENIYSAVALTGDHIYPGGFIGRQETDWITPNAASISLTNIVSMSTLYSTTMSAAYHANAISGALSNYTASKAYFLATNKDEALNKGSGNGKFTSMTDSNKASALSDLQSAWSGWKSGGTVKLYTGDYSAFPTFDAGYGI